MLYRAALTASLAALVAAGLASLSGASAAVLRGAVASATICSPLILEALLRAAGLPALQALAGTIMSVCAVMAAIIWHAVGECAAVAILPVVEAGEHGVTA